MMLNRNVDSRHFKLGPEFEGNVPNISPLSVNIG